MLFMVGPELLGGFVQIVIMGLVHMDWAGHICREQAQLTRQIRKWT